MSMESFRYTNYEGARVSLGKGNQIAGDTGLFSSRVFYCGRKLNQCRCGGCDGVCGPYDGCPCDSCKRFNEDFYGKIVNNPVGDPIHHGENVRCRENGQPCSILFYCGKRKNECRCGCCDRQCGPENGCSCNACKNVFDVIARYTTPNVNPFCNDDGIPVFRGIGSRQAGDTCLPCSEVYYCGRIMNECRCGSCDGQCGPTNGCPCNSCARLIAKDGCFNKTMVNSDGVQVHKGNGGKSGDVTRPSSSVYYCGRWMFECRCGNCDGRCGPSNGCPCNSCLPLLYQQSSFDDGLRNRSNIPVYRGTSRSDQTTLGIPATDVFYCGDFRATCPCGSCDSFCGPNSGCPCDDCKDLLVIENVNGGKSLLRNKSDIRVHRGSTIDTIHGVNIRADKVYYCGRWMDECRCGECDGRCGPNNGCPCNDCLELLQLSSTNNSNSTKVHVLDTRHIDASADENFDDLCVVCLSAPKSATFVHSDIGHTCCCMQCAKSVKSSSGLCPMCREPILSIIRVFK